MEHRGFEPLTSTMRTLRATNCANAPYNGWQPFDCQPFGLGERIRTSGLLNPIQARYQTAPHPVTDRFRAPAFRAVPSGDGKYYSTGPPGCQEKKTEKRPVVCWFVKHRLHINPVAGSRQRVEIFSAIRMPKKYYPTLTRHQVISSCWPAPGRP